MATSTSKVKVEAADAGKGPFMGMADVATLVAAIGAWFFALNHAFGPLELSTPTALPNLAITSVLIASAHVTYGLVWYKAAAFKRKCKQAPLKLLGKNPVDVFAVLVALTKLIQQIGLLGWACGWTVPPPPTALLTMVQAKAPVQLAMAAALMVAGQLLNLSIYHAIGKKGVYYGARLGARVPWSTAFPFSAGYQHPQYVGGYCTQLGVMLCVATPATLSAGMLPLAAYWAALYLGTRARPACEPAPRPLGAHAQRPYAPCTKKPTPGGERGRRAARDQVAVRPTALVCVNIHLHRGCASLRRTLTMRRTLTSPPSWDVFPV